MQTLGRRLLAVLLAAMLAVALLMPAAQAEDWRNLLRDAFGLSDGDYSAEDSNDGEDSSYDGGYSEDYDDGGGADDDWSLPITEPQRIVNYLDAFGELPENFITKKEAKQLGWDSSYNYVGDVAPGMSIGGDRFGNYEGQLPSKKGRTWYECDANYKGRKRGAERVLFSSDGLYYYTDDHYNTFTQMFPED